MAYRAPNSDTTLTSTTGWDTVVNTPTMHATTNTNANSTARFTGTFTAPNTTNKCTGVLLFCVSNASTTYTVTLQENSVDTAATVTLGTTALGSNNWAYFRFPTPYTFTTTTANAYRFKVTATGSSGTFASDSGGTLYCFLATTDITGAIGSSDILLVQGEGATTRTITFDGNVTFGNYGNNTVGNARGINNALTISKGAIVNADTTASATTTIKGNIVGINGEFNVGTAASPLPSAYTYTLIMENTVATDHGYYIYNGHSFKLQGAPKTNWKGKYVSGTGTAADPMITTGDIGEVGDEILVSPTGNSATNYSETEYRFIITKNSATSYVLSSTSGGAEAALVNTHSNKAWVLNLQRNIVIKGGTQAAYVSNSNTTVGNFDVDWARFENMGSSTTGKLGVQVARSTGMFGNIDNSVAYNWRYGGFIWTTSKYATSHTGLIACKGNSNGTIGGLYITSANSKSFTDCFAIGNNRAGVLSTGFNMSFTRCVFNGNNSVGTAATTNTGGAGLGGSGTMTDCEINCNRIMGISLSSATYEISSSEIGSYGDNAVDINALVDTSSSVTFTDCNFGSTSLLPGYAGLLPGSEIRFHNFNTTTNNHFWYSPFGYGRSTGAGLSDTTVRTPGSLAVRLTPTDIDDGFTWSFNIPAKAYSQVVFNGRFIKNAAFGTDVATVSLYLPGESTPAQTVALSNTYVETPGAIWDGVVLSANNTSPTDGLATIAINAKSVTSGAYIYMDDFYNAGDTITSTDKVTGLDTWDDGKPVQILSPQVLNISDIWNYPTTALTTPNTVGYNVAGAALAQLLIKDKLS